jgi:hypothetical protein
MSKTQTTRADTRPVLGPRFLTETPLVDIGSQANLR